MFTIDYVSKENGVVWFSSAMSSFKAYFKTEDYKDVDVSVNPNALCVLDSNGNDDSEILLAVFLTDDMCREVASLIENEI